MSHPHGVGDAKRNSNPECYANPHGNCHRYGVSNSNPECVSNRNRYGDPPPVRLCELLQYRGRLGYGAL